MKNFFNFFKKKAQGLSFNVIIVATIAIVVLVIVLVIFRGKSDVISKDLGNCMSKGGECVKVSDIESKTKTCNHEIPGEKLCLENYRCCLDL